VQARKELQSWMFGERVATGLRLGCRRTNAVAVRNLQTRLRFAGRPRCWQRTKFGDDFAREEPGAMRASVMAVAGVVGASALVGVTVADCSSDSKSSTAPSGSMASPLPALARSPVRRRPGQPTTPLC
jgi:hypothetical protein